MFFNILSYIIIAMSLIAIFGNLFFINSKRYPEYSAWHYLLTSIYNIGIILLALRVLGKV